MRLAAALLLAGAAYPAAGQTRLLYAIDEAEAGRGAVSVYDIDAGHRRLKTIATVPHVADVRGVAASAVTARLYVAYFDTANTGRLFCLDLHRDAVLWDRAVSPGVDRLAAAPDGKLLYVPSWEGGSADLLNIVDAENGSVLRQVHVARRAHDALYPRSGPVFLTTKAEDGNGRYLYRIDPGGDAVSRTGPYRGVLGPYAVSGAGRYVVDNVTGLWGMQIADLRTGAIATAEIPVHSPGNPGLMHGIGWTPDETEVWQSGAYGEPQIYVWDMRDPMAPKLKATLPLRSGRGAHWLTFSIAGDYAYVAPEKNRSDPTEIFDVRRHQSTGTIAASEDMLEIDLAGGGVTRVGDQYGIGRRR